MKTSSCCIAELEATGLMSEENATTSSALISGVLQVLPILDKLVSDDYCITLVRIVIVFDWERKKI